MNFDQALYWFLLHPTVVLVSVGTVTTMVLLVSLLLILRKWGDYN